jgi:hypothetical protein
MELDEEAGANSAVEATLAFACSELINKVSGSV